MLAIQSVVCLEYEKNIEKLSVAKRYPEHVTLSLVFISKLMGLILKKAYQKCRAGS